MIPALAVAAVALAIRLLVAEYLPLIDPDGVVYVSIAKQVHASGSPRSITRSIRSASRSPSRSSASGRRRADGSPRSSARS
jgi:hypothetical protein